MLKHTLLVLVYLCKIVLFASVQSQPIYSGHPVSSSSSSSSQDVSRRRNPERKGESRSTIRRSLMNQSKNIAKELTKKKYETTYMKPLDQTCEFDVPTANVNGWRSSTTVHLDHLELVTTILDNFINSCSVKQSVRSKRLFLLFDNYRSNVYEYTRRTKMQNANKSEKKRTEKHVDVDPFRYIHFSFTKQCLRIFLSYCLTVITSPVEVNRVAMKFYNTCSETIR